MVWTVKLFYLLNILILIASLVFLIILVIQNTSNSYSPQQEHTLSERHSVSVSVRTGKNPFKCYDDIESIVLKDFYRLDCKNPFLKNISLRNLDAKVDVCEVFKRISRWRRQ